ncbi:MAG: orotidine-5'-phosphate decarboxylase [Phototrophicaceae bacterium]
MSMIDKYNARVDTANSLLCIGLDSNIKRLPEQFLTMDYPQFEFNKWIIEQTHAYVAAYKPNMAFYEARGAQGLVELQMTMDFLCEQYPDIYTICDAKRADIGSTNDAYASAIFDELGFDAVTLHPYLGRDAMLPFLQRSDKGCIILCRTSNSSAIEFQDLQIENRYLWEIVAERVAQEWNSNGNCMLVVGATYPNEMKIVREIIGDMTLLVPGIGVQGGNVQQTVSAGLNRDGKGLIINSSRGIVFSENPERAAQELRDGINLYR